MSRWEELARSASDDSPSPINALSFSKSGSFLASGDDDCLVTIWSLENNRLRIRQVLNDELWGQITALQLDDADPLIMKRTLMFVGTGEGTLSVCWLQSTGLFSTQKLTVCPFDEIQPVSHLKYHPLTGRLVVGGMAGTIAFYDFEVEDLRLKYLFSQDVMDIPRDIHFIGSSAESLLVHCLRAGRIICLDSATGRQVWRKNFIGSIGHAALSRNQKLHLTQNLGTGQYDLYSFTSSKLKPEAQAVPLRSFQVPASQDSLDISTEPCAFVESDSVAVLTSGAGVVRLVAVETGELMQELMHGNGTTDIQALAVWQSRDGSYSYIALGSTNPSLISVWKKHTPHMIVKGKSGRVYRKKARATSSSKSSTLKSASGVLIIALLSLVAWRDYAVWSPYLACIVPHAGKLCQLAYLRVVAVVQSALINIGSRMNV